MGLLRASYQDLKRSFRVPNASEWNDDASAQWLLEQGGVLLRIRDDRSPGRRARAGAGHSRSSLSALRTARPRQRQVAPAALVALLDALRDEGRCTD